jgi:hypothetical protein
VKGFGEPIRCYKVIGLYDDVVREGQVIREEQEGFKFMLDLQKRDKQEAIARLQAILARLRSGHKLNTKRTGLTMNDGSAKVGILTSLPVRLYSRICDARHEWADTHSYG